LSIHVCASSDLIFSCHFTLKFLDDHLFMITIDILIPNYFYMMEKSKMFWPISFPILSQ
jgi:hypothetical protein